MRSTGYAVPFISRWLAVIGAFRSSLFWREVVHSVVRCCTVFLLRFLIMGIICLLSVTHCLYYVLQLRILLNYLLLSVCNSFSHQSKNWSNRLAVTVAIECIVSVSRERLSYDAHLFLFYKYLLLIKQSSTLKVKKVHIYNQLTSPKTCESVDCKKNTFHRFWSVSGGWRYRKDCSEGISTF